MNMLIIGNGFDLAHKLPTSYKDFLKFVEEVQDFVEFRKVAKNMARSKKYFNFLLEFSTTKSGIKCISDICNFSKDNLWIDYFNRYLNDDNLSFKENWIDFELEISKFVQVLDSMNKSKNHCIKNDYEIFINNNYSFKAKTSDVSFLENLYPNLIKNHHASFFLAENKKGYLIELTFFNNLKKQLTNDLNYLIRCLEIYLSCYINTLNNKIRIKEIDELSSNINYVLSFNYTNTYERLYGNNKDVKYDYIHGKADLNHSLESCSLVLGIDEYLDETEKNENIDFIQFKKYFQRIYKKTGCEYINLLEDLNESLNIYIFGHSLDITDKDVLHKLITNSSSKTTIYYHDDDSYKKQIANLVRVLSQDVLIDSVYGKNPRIKFVKQKKVKESEEKSIVESEIKEVSTIAAHNDHLKDPDEKEKILDDFNDIDEW